jgi:sec-independent protein translocase protein TatC
VKILKKDDDKKTSAKKKSAVSKDIKKKKSQPLVEAENNPSVENNDSPDKKSFMDSAGLVGQFDRFRSKILITLLLFMILTPVIFYFSGILLKYVNKPFVDTGNKLNIFTLMGGFMLRFKTSAAAALFILMPLIIYQAWSIVSGAAGKKRKWFSKLVVIIAVILFYSGIAAAFFFLLPLMVKMMLSFNHAEMLSTIGADSYLSFALLLCLSMGLIFEVPIIAFVLTRMGIITPKMLSSKRKYVIVIIWIIAAVITPPDVLSQVMVAVPLMIIFEISILISKIAARSGK